MTYRGHVKNGQILLDDEARLPDGAQVRIELLENGKGESANRTTDDLNAVLLRHAGKGCNLPPDLAMQHDHYAHGKPKS